MLRNTIMVFLVMLVVGCGGLDLKGAADEIVSAFDGKCLVFAKKDGDKNKDDAKDSEASSDSSGSSADTGGCGNNSGDQDMASDSGAGNSNDDSLSSSDDDSSGGSSSGDSGYTFEQNGGGGASYFLGTFDKSDGYYSCPDWPAVIRVYSVSDEIQFVSNTGDVVAEGPIFEDGTWDFTANYQDEFGRDNVNLNCTCDYTDYQVYNDKIWCSCDFDDESEACSLTYQQQ